MDDYKLMYPELLRTAHRMRNAGMEVDEILFALRQRCPSIIQSIKAVRDVLGISLGEAKIVVESSTVWGDKTDEFEKLHDSAEEIFGQSLTEQEDGSRRVDIDLASNEEE